MLILNSLIFILKCLLRFCFKQEITHTKPLFEYDSIRKMHLVGRLLANSCEFAVMFHKLFVVVVVGGGAITCASTRK